MQKQIEIEDEMDCELRSIRTKFAKLRPVSRTVEVNIFQRGHLTHQGRNPRRKGDYRRRRVRI